MTEMGLDLNIISSIRFYQIIDTELNTI
jgi:hypothetical protein